MFFIVVFIIQCIFLGIPPVSVQAVRGKGAPGDLPHLQRGLRQLLLTAGGAEDRTQDCSAGEECAQEAGKCEERPRDQVGNKGPTFFYQLLRRGLAY